MKEGDARAGELIVQFRPSVDESAEERALRDVRAAVAARRASRRGLYLVSLDSDSSVPAALDRLSGMPEVEFAERNGLLRRTQARTFQPNDQFYRFQWNMEQIGAERTWGIQQGQLAPGSGLSCSTRASPTRPISMP